MYKQNNVFTSSQKNIFNTIINKESNGCKYVIIDDS